MNKQQPQKGFSLLELILVICLIAITLGLSLLYYDVAIFRSDINAQVGVFASNVRLAYSDALAGLNDQPQGVHLEQTKYVIFEGGAYDANNSINFSVELPPNMTIENINLNGGGSDIIFQGAKGETLNYGTLDFVSNRIDKTITIEISKFGTVTY